MPTATPEDIVTLHYIARTSDGGVIEDTTHRKPVTFRLDDACYLDSLRQAVVGMAPGERKTIRLDPGRAYGERDHRMQLNVPLAALPTGIQDGDQLSVTVNDQELDVWVAQVNTQEAVLDINHPLAGEILEFTIDLLSITPADRRNPPENPLADARWPA